MQFCYMLKMFLLIALDYQESVGPVCCWSLHPLLGNPSVCPEVKQEDC